MKRFWQYLLIGTSALVLLAGSQVGVFGQNWQRGPQEVLAQAAGECIDGWTFLGGDPNDSANWVEGCSDGSDSGGQGGQGGQGGDQCPAPREYPQCGATCSNGSWDSSHTVLVRENYDSSCNVWYGPCDDLGVIIGQCGNVAPTP